MKKKMKKTSQPAEKDKNLSKEKAQPKEKQIPKKKKKH